MIKLSIPNPPKQQMLEQANNLWAKVKKDNVNEIKNTIARFLATPVPLTRYGFQVLNVRNSRSLRPLVPEPIQIRPELDKENQVPRNAIAQCFTIIEREHAQKKVAEYATILDMSTDNPMRQHLVNQINTEKQIILQQNKRLDYLKRHAAAQGRLRERK